MSIRFKGPKVLIITANTPVIVRSALEEDIPNVLSFRHLRGNIDYVVVIEKGIVRRYPKNRIIELTGLAELLYL